MTERDLAETDGARARRLKLVEAVAVSGMTYKEAAAYAGVAYDTAQKVLRHPKVKKYIRRLQAANAKRLNVSREEVIEGIQGAIGRAIMLGEPATEIRGWEQIAKLQGHYAPERRVLELPQEASKFIEAVQSLGDQQIAELAGQKNLIELSPDDYKRTDDEG